jgi:hypothetical protein
MALIWTNIENILSYVIDAYIRFPDTIYNPDMWNA